MIRRSRNSCRAFTILELLVVICIVLIVVAILVPALMSVRRAGKQADCVNNLRQVFTAFTLFANSHNGTLPDPAAAEEAWESLLLPMLTPRTFQCAADEELFPAVGSSYDWRDTGEPTTTLAGRPLVQAPSDTVLAFDCLPGWHSKRKMNAVTTGGVAEPMDVQKCLGNVSRPLRPASKP